MEPDYTALAEADIASASGTADQRHAERGLARAQVYATLAVAQAIRHQTAAMALDDTDRAALDEYRERDYESGIERPS
jgi:hypothetical protein